MRQENPQLWHDLPPVIKEAVFARVRGQLPAIVRHITDEIGKNVDQLIDAKLMVISYFVKHPELLNELFLIMGRKELTVHAELRLLLRPADGLRAVRHPAGLPALVRAAARRRDHRLGGQLHRHHDDLRAGATRAGGCRGGRGC